MSPLRLTIIQLFISSLLLIACHSSTPAVPDVMPPMPPAVTPDPVFDAGQVLSESRFADCQGTIDALRTGATEQCIAAAADCTAGLRCVGVEE